jgi:hypothetical protein
MDHPYIQFFTSVGPPMVDNFTQSITSIVE